MIYFELLTLTAVFIIILIIVLFPFPKFKEYMRVIPRPNRHPVLTEDVIENDVIRDVPRRRIDINEEIDSLVKLYFDNDGIPTDFAIQKYYDSFVNHGFVTEENKMRMKDFCYYLIQFAIPNLPSENNPNPTTIWPYIEFLSNSVSSYSVQSGTKTYTPFMLYEVTPSEFDVINGKKNSGPSGATDSSSGSGAGSGSGSGSRSNSGANANGKCGCPDACFSNLLKAMATNQSKSPGSYTPGSSSTSSTVNVSTIISSNDPNAGINIKDATLFSKSLNSIYSRPKSGFLRITNEKMEKEKFDAWIKNSKDNVAVNDYVNQFIKTYFGIDKTNPISIGKPAEKLMVPFPSGDIEFKDFVESRSLIDQRHVNILIDLVYYFMENIIPGLPTENVPISYVEWRQIVWSSGSFL